MQEQEARPRFPKRAIVTAGMPYGNKGLHFGHIAGVFVPADVYARFLRDRIGADNVMFVSGTDCYGSPINEGYRKLVEEEGFEGTILDYVKGNHDAQKRALDAYGISLDIYEGSGLGRSKEVHEEVTRRFITRLWENGFLEKRSTAQFYDTEAQTFLNGRQVVGHCPVQGCKSEKGYADECDLGHQYMPADLIDPKSTLTGQTPEMRDVTNWYFKLPDFRGILDEFVDDCEQRDNVRPVVSTTIGEFLVPPVIYIKNELQGRYMALRDKMPQHVFIPAEEDKASFTLRFDDIDTRDQARDVLAKAGIRFRTGKALVPFRLTGNIDWGVPAPTLDGSTEGLTVWCWPESLWAPISFSTACLLERGHDADEWKDWWCSDDATVFQFIGQDNIYFYGVAQPAMWSATQQGHEPCEEGVDDELRQTTLVANHHVLFMGKKASSSGAIKPPMAIDLLDHYTPEQLRAHFISLGLGMKSASFSPKPYDASAKPDAADPALKEGALLTNVFNRLARSCFYATQRESGVVVEDAEKGIEGNGAQSYMPLGTPSPELVSAARDVALQYEQLMYHTEFHSLTALLEGYIRDANKYWNDNSKANAGDLHQTLVDSFYLLRMCSVLMHPIAPFGTEKIRMYLGFDRDFWSWDHIFDGNEAFCSPEEIAAGKHAVKTLPKRTDFFAKHPSQIDEGKGGKK